MDNKSVILPNGQLANNSVINVTAMDCRRLDLVIGISYTSDLKLAKETLMKVLTDDTATMKDKELLVYVDAQLIHHCSELVSVFSQVDNLR